ncbi:MAG: tetratricopeptide repeat protein [Clostridiales bacterium]|jgi:hypothetical protein|nr:tetratricopeptide repeat protein [Clostridiales bacterium]
MASAQYVKSVLERFKLNQKYSGIEGLNELLVDISNLIKSGDFIQAEKMTSYGIGLTASPTDLEYPMIGAMLLDQKAFALRKLGRNADADTFDGLAKEVLDVVAFKNKLAEATELVKAAKFHASYGNVSKANYYRDAARSIDVSNASDSELVDMKELLAQTSLLLEENSEAEAAFIEVISILKDLKLKDFATRILLSYNYLLIVTEGDEQKSVMHSRDALSFADSIGFSECEPGLLDPLIFQSHAHASHDPEVNLYLLNAIEDVIATRSSDKLPDYVWSIYVDCCVNEYAENAALDDISYALIRTEKCLAAVESSDRPDLIPKAQWLAAYLLASKDGRQASTLASRAVNACRASGNTQAPFYASALVICADSHFAMHQLPKAVAEYEEALQIMKTRFGDGSKLVLHCSERLHKIKEKSNKPVSAPQGHKGGKRKK